MKRALTVIAMVLVSVGVSLAGPMEIPEGLKCHLCGMKVDPASSYSAQIVKGNETLTFCDIGDMLYFYNKHEEKPSELYVRDMRSREWTAASAAVYVKSDSFESPMGWGIAAFSSKEEAAMFGEPMTFNEVLSAVK